MKRACFPISWRWLRIPAIARRLVDVVNNQPVIQLKDVCRVYRPGVNEVRALDHVDLTVYAGEFVAVVGNSGSGKSTMMNILGCLDLPDSGEYFLDGQNVANLPDREVSKIRRQEIGFVFQSFHLIPTLTALENVELPLLYKKMAAADRKRRCVEALELVGLSGRANHRPNEMSGGQQQRVAVARAVAGDPRVILADEPTGNLDSKMGSEILGLLLALSNRGTTVVLITHDPAIAEKAGRVVTVKDGKIVGDTGEKRRPAAAGQPGPVHGAAGG